MDGMSGASAALLPLAQALAHKVGRASVRPALVALHVASTHLIAVATRRLLAPAPVPVLVLMPSRVLQ